MKVLASLVLLAFSVAEANRCYECIHSKVTKGLRTEEAPNAACKSGDPALLEKGVREGTVRIKECPYLCGYVEGSFDIGLTDIDRKTYDMTGRGCSDSADKIIGCDRNPKYMDDLLDILLANDPLGKAMERDIHESLGCDCQGDLCTAGSASIGVSVGLILLAMVMKVMLV